MLSNKELKKMKHNVAYTIQKYYSCIDFSKLSEVDALAYRYLMSEILALKEHYDEIKIKKELNKWKK